jgi:hypothetical protein
MIFHPPILALVAASLISSAVLAGAGLFALRLLRHWDPSSGAQRQIELERVTTLVSTVVAFVLVVEAASLVLFAFNADRMAPLFVGAMCAVGTLNASVFGFPTLWAKIVVFFAAFSWLAVDRVDGRTRDYALIRPKYAGLLVLAPLVFTEGALELAYFLDLKADTITSCCGKLFGEDKPNLGGDLAALDPVLAMGLLAGGLVAAIGFGIVAPRGRALAALHGVASIAVFGLALAAIVAAVAPYVYEQPHHHCPFCILKREYGHVGFALYVPLFVATGAGIASALLVPFDTRVDGGVATAARRALAGTAVVGHLLFALVAVVLVMRSGLTLLA